VLPALAFASEASKLDTGDTAWMVDLRV